jgi:hypothetical protein
MWPPPPPPRLRSRERREQNGSPPSRHLRLSRRPAANGADSDTVAKPIDLDAVRQQLESERKRIEGQLGMTIAPVANNKLGGGAYRQRKTRRASRRRLTRKKYVRKAPKTRKQRNKNTRRK